MTALTRDDELYKYLLRLLEKYTSDRLINATISRRDLRQKMPRSSADKLIELLEESGLCVVYYEGNKKMIKLSDRILELLSKLSKK
ncbi:MAG: hypothetical protein QW051_00620 [Candidatus Aenigmatarchaeota archaeon]